MLFEQPVPPDWMGGGPASEGIASEIAGTIDAIFREAACAPQIAKMIDWNASRWRAWLRDQMDKVLTAEPAVSGDQAHRTATDSREAKKSKRSTESGKSQDTGQAVRRLLSVFTNGLADEWLEKAASVLENSSLNANDKLTQVDELMRFPPTSSAQQLGDMLGVTKQAVMKTKWWIDNRKGEKDNEVGRRRDKHRERAKQHQPDRTDKKDD